MTATTISAVCDGGRAHQLRRGVSQIAAKATLCSAMPHFDSGPYFAPDSSAFECDLLICRRRTNARPKINHAIITRAKAVRPMASVCKGLAPEKFYGANARNVSRQRSGKGLCRFVVTRNLRKK